MSEFKVGDKVRVIGKRNTSSQDHFGEVFTINTIDTNDHFNEQYVIAKEFKSNGIWVCDLELAVPKVVKRTEIRIEDGAVGVNHVTNTKKNRVTLLFNKSKTGTIKFAEIDKYIELLTQLKSEV